MLIGSAQTVLSSLGYELDCRSEAFGYLRDSSDLLSQPEQLRLRMQEDGYLYLRGLLNPQWVWQARFEIAAQLAAEGCLAVGSPMMDCIARPGLTIDLSLI